MNSFLNNMPCVTDLGDGRIMVEGRDKGHYMKMIEPDGKVSMVISLNDPTPKLDPKPLPKLKPDPDNSFHVRDYGSSQEIVDAQGVVVARCTDPAMAKHIKCLLVVYENLQARKASSGA